MLVRAVHRKFTVVRSRPPGGQRVSHRLCQDSGSAGRRDNQPPGALGSRKSRGRLPHRPLQPHRHLRGTPGEPVRRLLQKPTSRDSSVESTILPGKLRFFLTKSESGSSGRGPANFELRLTAPYHLGVASAQHTFWVLCSVKEVSSTQVIPGHVWNAEPSQAKPLELHFVSALNQSFVLLPRILFSRVR